jgi:DNA-binding LacI/PurR family transcriptional regulator
MNMSIPATRLTQRDLARELGVSYSTVSLALRDSPKIALAQRQRIQQAALERGYQPNAAAAALAHFRRASHSRPVQAALAWLNFRPDPTELFRYREFELYWKGASACAEKHGYHLEEFLGRDYRSLKRLEAVLLARGIEGIIIPPHGVTPEWGDFDWSRFSVVRFGRTVEKPRAHLVTSDQPTNAILAFNEIRRRGYERVGLVAGWPNLISGASWTGGFLQAQQFIDEKERLPILVMKDDLATSQRQLAQWMKKHRPDAIFTDLKEVAPMLRNLGVRVPEDVGLAVTSVLDAGADAGIYQNSEEIGRAVVLALLSLIKDHDRGTVDAEHQILREVLIMGRWQEGASLPWRGQKNLE